MLSRIPTPNELHGSFGEWLAKLYSKHFTDALVLHDVIIDGAEGRTSQTDLILIGAKGLYVVEVKLFDGAKVYGDGNKRTWYYYRGGKKYEFYSPKMQNAKHIEYLKRLLGGFGEVPCFSVITMICDDFKVSNINGPGKADTLICSSLPAMKRGMLKLTEGCPEVLDEAKRQQLFDHISAHSHDSSEARFAHKTQVGEYKAALAEEQARNVCPCCGAPLVLKNGRFGEFWGCTNYPKCSYTRKV